MPCISSEGVRTGPAGPAKRPEVTLGPEILRNSCVRDNLTVSTSSESDVYFHFAF